MVMIAGIAIAAVCVAIATVAYCYVLYPSCVLGIGALVPKRSAPSGASRCTVVLVARNEGRRVLRRLRNIARQVPAGGIECVILVDDGSDESLSRLVEGNPIRGLNVRVVQSTGGKAAGVNAGMRAAPSEIVVLCDARQVFDRTAVHHLCRWFDDPEVGLVAGVIKYTVEKRSGARHVSAGVRYWKAERALREAEAKLGLLACVSGAVYAVRRNAMPVLPANLVLDDVYVPLMVGRSGKRIVVDSEAIAWDVEVPEDRELSRRRRTLAGNFQLFKLIPESLWMFGSRQRFGFVSHKALRLLVPFASVIAATAVVLAMPAAGRLIALALVVAAVILAHLQARGYIRGQLGRGIADMKKLVETNALIFAAAWDALFGREIDQWAPPKSKRSS